jgi:hypothetical protein
MRTIAAMFVVILCVGCGATRGGREVEERGFLGDYSQLKENPGEGVDLRYIASGIDWKRYDKILLDPVQFWRSADVEAGLSAEDAQELADYFYGVLRERLSAHYTMVTAPESGALRISIAFIRLGERNVTLDTISTYWPVGRVLSEGAGGITGKPGFVGEAAFEGKITDATTGELLGAALDHRVGGKTIKGFGDWADVRAASDLWAKELAVRLCTLRGVEACGEMG